MAREIRERHETPEFTQEANGHSLIGAGLQHGQNCRMPD